MLAKRSNSFLKIKTLFISAVLLVLLTKCYVPSEYLESDLIPEGERLAVKTDTTFILSAHTVTYETVDARGLDVIILGAIYDDVFGQVKSSFMSEIRLSSITRKFGLNPSVDSAFFILKLNSFYGNKSIPLNVTMFELSKSIKADSLYNALQPVGSMIYPTPIGTTTYQGEKYLRIPISIDFANKLINANEETMASQEAFNGYIKGIYITADLLADPIGNDGKVMHYFNYADAENKLTLYYTSTYSNEIVDTTFNYYFSTGTLHNLRFQHDHSTANPATAIPNLNNTETQDSVFYLQGLGGTRGLVKLEGLSDWASKMPVIINRAELRIEPQQVPFFEADSILTDINIFKKNSANEYVAITDLQYFSGTFGGNYIKYKGYYSFNITNHLQEQLRSLSPDLNIYLEPRNRFSRASQTILKSGNNSKKIKLIITYTKL